MINLKMCLVFEATLQTFVKKNEKVYFTLKRCFSYCANIQNTHTRWNAGIEFHKIHLAYQAQESTHKMKCT